MFGSRGKSSDESGKVAVIAAEARRQTRPLRDASDLDPLLERGLPKVVEPARLRTRPRRATELR